MKQTCCLPWQRASAFPHTSQSQRTRLDPHPQGQPTLRCSWVPSLLTFPLHYSCQGLQGLTPGDPSQPGSQALCPLALYSVKPKSTSPHRIPRSSANALSLCSLTGSFLNVCQPPAGCEGQPLPSISGMCSGHHAPTRRPQGYSQHCLGLPEPSG